MPSEEPLPCPQGNGTYHHGPCWLCPPAESYFDGEHNFRSKDLGQNYEVLWATFNKHFRSAYERVHEQCELSSDLHERCIHDGVMRWRVLGQRSRQLNQLPRLRKQRKKICLIGEAGF